MIESSSDDEVQIKRGPSIVPKFDALEYMKNMGYVPGMGLGAQNQGILVPIMPTRRCNTKLGLGGTTNKPPIAHPYDSKDKEVDNVKEYLGLLYDLRRIIGTDFSLHDFYTKFNSTPLWDQLQLTDILIYKMKTLLNDPLAMKTFVGLGICRQCLNRKQHLEILDKWMDSALRANPSALIHFHHFDLIKPISIRFSNSVVELIIKNFPSLFRNLLKNRGFSGVVENHIHSLTPDLILPYLDATGNYATLPIDGLTLKELIQKIDMLNGTVHYKGILEKLIFPRWVYLLESQAATLDTIFNDLLLIKKMSVTNPAIDKAVNIIHYYLDTNRFMAHGPDFTDVISTFCSIHNYHHMRTGEETGLIIGPNLKQLKYFVKDDVLFCISENGVYPFAIDDIPAYVH